MPSKLKIAVVDDEKDMRQSIGQWLGLTGYDTTAYESAEAALADISADYPGLVITDIRMPGMDGMAFLKRLMSIDNALPVIMITGHGDVPMAVEAMRLGAFDFLEKPFDPARMEALVRRAATARRLTLDNRALRRELSEGGGLMERLAGASSAMERLRAQLVDLGQAEGHVLIEGETGTGKTLAAHALHAVGAGGRRFALVSCGGADEETLAARLFEGEAGAQAALEQARGGTVVLEDIEALPDVLQSRLLAWMNDLPEGDGTRVVAISNLARADTTCQDVLRPDLYFRLATLKLTLPPLRAREQDVLALFHHFATRFADDYGVDAPGLSTEDAAQLLQAPWPGNVRQLMNLAERAILAVGQGGGEAPSIASLLMEDSESGAAAITPEGKPLKEHVEAFERMLIDNTMRRHKGAITAVMEELSLPRRTLNEKMAKYGLSRSDYL